MIIHFTLNGAPQELTVNPGENVQKLLFNMGMHSVRNSDDGFGFAGSDAIIFNGNIVNASLLIAAQLEKADIRTAESLGKWNELSLVQQAMVDVGVVQSGYNDPAAALIITDLLDRIAAPTREEIDDALLTSPGSALRSTAPCPAPTGKPSTPSWTSSSPSRDTSSRPTRTPSEPFSIRSTKMARSRA